MEGKKDVPDACVRCKGAYCRRMGVINGETVGILDPWPTFLKLSKVTGINHYLEELNDQEHLSKPDTDVFHL
jgi:hypothetical protein